MRLISQSSYHLIIISFKITNNCKRPFDCLIKTAILKCTLSLALFLISASQAFSQADISTVKQLEEKQRAFEDSRDLDSIFHYATKSLTLSTRIKYQEGIANATASYGMVYKLKGNFPKALACFFKSLAIHESLKDKKRISVVLMNIGTIYDAQEDFQKALEYYFKSLQNAEVIKYKEIIAW